VIMIVRMTVVEAVTVEKMRRASLYAHHHCLPYTSHSSQHTRMNACPTHVTARSTLV